MVMKEEPQVTVPMTPTTALMKRRRARQLVVQINIEMPTTAAPRRVLSEGGRWRSSVCAHKGARMERHKR